MEEELKTNGFTQEALLWSFTPSFISKSKGKYFSKIIPYNNGKSNQIEIGVILNDEYKSMEVYACDCSVGCCGRDMGMHPFSIEKINSLIADEIKWLDEVYTK